MADVILDDAITDLAPCQSAPSLIQSAFWMSLTRAQQKTLRRLIEQAARATMDLNRPLKKADAAFEACFPHRDSATMCPTLPAVDSQKLRDGSHSQGILVSDAEAMIDLIYEKNLRGARVTAIRYRFLNEIALAKGISIAFRVPTEAPVRETLNDLGSGAYEKRLLGDDGRNAFESNLPRLVRELRKAMPEMDKGIAIADALVTKMSIALRHASAPAKERAHA